MSLGVQLAVILLIVGLPAAVFGIVALRLRAKERARDAYLRAVTDRLRAAGFEPQGYGIYRTGGRTVKVEAGTNPLFLKPLSVRLAAYSPTVHEFELKRGRPVDPAFEPFRPLLRRWGSAGKMHVECYAAGVTTDPDVTEDLRHLLRLAELPLSQTWSGGIFTVREGFEEKVPQWHWRHDQRPRLPPGARRWCVSCWHGDPYLNGGLVRLFDALAGGKRRFYISDSEDLGFLDYAFGRKGIAIHGTLVELTDSTLALAADRYLDGQFFGGLLVADEIPPGWEDVKRYRFHDRAVDVLGQVDFYVRRLFDEEFAWYSGEYEIMSARPLEVRAALDKVAAEMGAQVLPIDRRFNKRIVAPPKY